MVMDDTYGDELKLDKYKPMGLQCMIGSITSEGLFCIVVTEDTILCEYSLINSFLEDF